MERRRPLLGMTLEQLRQLAADEGLPRYAASQMAQWIYGRGARSIEEMTNLSKASRERLGERYEVGHVSSAAKFVSTDGTKKYLFPTGTEGKYIETVMIPQYDDPDEVTGSRMTICVSSQVGCKMNCSFCMTGRGGFHGNLTTGEIISQFMNIDEAGELTNAVFMGMGEPLDNWENVSAALEILTSDWGFGWSPKRITVSTIGVLPNLKKFLDGSRCHLAVSLHNPFPEERAALMPVQKGFDILKVVELLRQYDFSGQRRVSFEYTMFAGVNDTKRHADALVRLLKGLQCRINMIRFHTIPESSLKPSDEGTIEQFKARLNNAGIITTLRASRGEDIMAACGLLAGRGLEKEA